MSSKTLILLTLIAVIHVSFFLHCDGSYIHPSKRINRDPNSRGGLLDRHSPPYSPDLPHGNPPRYADLFHQAVMLASFSLPRFLQTRGATSNQSPFNRPEWLYFALQFLVSILLSPAEGVKYGIERTLAGDPYDTRIETSPLQIPNPYDVVRKHKEDLLDSLQSNYESAEVGTNVDVKFIGNQLYFYLLRYRSDVGMASAWYAFHETLPTFYARQYSYNEKTNEFSRTTHLFTLHSTTRNKSGNWGAGMGIITDMFTIDAYGRELDRMASLVPNFNITLASAFKPRQTRSLSCTSSGVSFLWVHPTVTCDGMESVISDEVSKINDQRNKDMSWVSGQFNTLNHRIIDYTAAQSRATQAIADITALNTLTIGTTSQEVVSLTFHMTQVKVRNYGNELLDLISDTNDILTFLDYPDSPNRMALLPDLVRDTLFSSTDRRSIVSDPIFRITYNGGSILLNVTLVVSPAVTTRARLIPLEATKVDHGVLIHPIREIFYSSVGILEKGHEILPGHASYHKLQVDIPKDAIVVDIQSQAGILSQEHFFQIFQGKCYQVLSPVSSANSPCANVHFHGTKVVKIGSIAELPEAVQVTLPPVVSLDNMFHSLSALNQTTANLTAKWQETVVPPVSGISFKDYNAVHSSFTLGNSILTVFLIISLALTLFFGRRMIKRNRTCIDVLKADLKEMEDRLLVYVNMPEDRRVSHPTYLRTIEMAPVTTGTLSKTIWINGSRVEVQIVSGEQDGQYAMIFPHEGKTVKRMITSDQLTRLMSATAPQVAITGKSGVTVV